MKYRVNPHKLGLNTKVVGSEFLVRKGNAIIFQSLNWWLVDHWLMGYAACMDWVNEVVARAQAAKTEPGKEKEPEQQALQEAAKRSGQAVDRTS